MLLKLVEQLVLLHISLHLVSDLVQNQTKLVHVLLLVNLWVRMLVRLCSVQEMRFNLRCHVSLGPGNRREPGIPSGERNRVRAPSDKRYLGASFGFLL